MLILKEKVADKLLASLQVSHFTLYFRELRLFECGQVPKRTKSIRNAQFTSNMTFLQQH